jgi:anaerobic ribonucleoside-triphosphate reductase activating protein
MLLLASFDIVFQEVPGETTLALNLSDCPNQCPGCHSVHLQQPVGEQLTEELLAGLLDRYGKQITTVAFMGGDRDPAGLNNLTKFLRNSYNLKIAWYSGRCEIPKEIEVKLFNFIKLGPYVEKLGGLDSPTTNQRFYRVAEDGSMVDETAKFRRAAPGINRK